MIHSSWLHGSTERHITHEIKSGTKTMRAYILSQYDIHTDASPGLYVSEDEKQLLQSTPEGRRYGLRPVEVDPEMFEDNKRKRPNGMSDLLSLAKLKAQR